MPDGRPVPWWPTDRRRDRVAMFALQERGTLFVEPGSSVY